MWIRNFFLLLLALALVASLVLNYFFYQKAFIPLHATKLDPVGLDYYSAEQNQSRLTEKPKLMYFGDSRALSWPAYKTTDYEFVNRAIGNQTSTQILQRFETHVAPHKPEVILVQMCVNDLKMIPLFPKRKDRIIEDCKKNIQGVITKARKLEADVVLTTVFPLGDISIFRKALGASEAPIIDGIGQVNQYINSLAADDVLIFDSYALLVGENRKINPDYSRDWLHLNSQGYKQLNSALKDFIDQTLSRN